MRHRTRPPRRPAFVHPGESDGLRRRLRRPVLRARVRELHGDRVYGSSGTGADDLRLAAPAALGLAPARAAPDRRLAILRSATRPSSGCSRPSIRRTAICGSASTTRPATRSRQRSTTRAAFARRRRTLRGRFARRRRRPTSPCRGARASTATTRVSRSPRGGPPDLDRHTQARRARRRSTRRAHEGRFARP